MSQPLSNLAPGSLLKLNETVSGATAAQLFLVLGHGHHGADVTTLLRQSPWSVSMRFQKLGISGNSYSGSGLDNWLTGTYRNYLEPAAQELLTAVSIRTNKGASSIGRSIFLLSGTEYGHSSSYLPVEGTAIAYFADNALRQARVNGSLVGHWTRSGRTNDVDEAAWIQPMGGLSTTGDVYNDYYYVRPALTMVSDARVAEDPDPDGAYRLSDAASVPVRVLGAWRGAEPMAKAAGVWCAARPKIKASGVWYDAG